MIRVQSLKFTNWVSLLFLGVAVFLFYRYPFHHSEDMAEAAPKSIYDFTVKVLGFGFFFFFFSFFSLPSVWLLRKVGKGNANKILNLGVSRVVVSCPKNWIFRGF